VEGFGWWWMITLKLDGKEIKLLTSEDMQDIVNLVTKQVMNGMDMIKAHKKAETSGRAVDIKKESKKETDKKNLMKELLEEI
jgi:hypothetical protein